MAQTISCVICANSAAAVALVAAIDGLLGYPVANTHEGGGARLPPASTSTTDHYTYIRKHNVDGRKAVVIDSVILALNGQSYGGTTIDTSSAEPLDMHTWNEDTDTWPT